VTRIALFVTCLADTLFPDVGKATVRLLERVEGVHGPRTLEVIVVA
jgi:Fe-S oxidoreductase